MASKEDVDRFLSDFRAKMAVFDIVYLNRAKNLQALAKLEITPFDRKGFLKKLTVANYYRGPTTDNEHLSDLWEFGLLIRSSEVYIKIQLGVQQYPAICISFHLAEHPMNYPYK